MASKAGLLSFSECFEFLFYSNDPFHEREFSRPQFVLLHEVLAFLGD